MSKWTSVPVRKETRDRLEDHSEKSGRDWDTFIRRELLGEDIDGGPVAGEDVLAGMSDGLAKEIASQVRFPTADVKTAVREVLREELPEGALR